MLVVLHWIYIGIVALVALGVLAEIFRERAWNHQLAYALILLPLVLRILHLK